MLTEGDRLDWLAIVEACEREGTAERLECPSCGTGLLSVTGSGLILGVCHMDGCEGQDALSQTPGQWEIVLR